MSDLPDGFIIDEPQKPSGLPEGFVLDETSGAKKPREYAASEVPMQAVTNFIPSLIKNVRDMGEGLVDAVTSPVQTAGTLTKLMTTTSPLMPDIRLLSKMISPLLDEEGRKRVGKAVEDLYAPRDALVKQYSDKYGGWENIKRTLAEDPAGVAMDVSTLLTPVAAAKNAPGMIGKVGKVANTIANVTDPVGLAAAGVGKVAGTIIPEVLGKSTGAGADAFKEAARAGYEGGDAATNFRKAITNQLPAEEIVGLAKQGVQKIRDNMMADYRANQKVWEQYGGRIDFTPIDREATRILSSMQTKGGHSKLAPTEQTQLQKLLGVVDEWQRDPTEHTIEGLDGLKQRLRNEIDPKTAHPQISRAATALADATRKAIVKSAPKEYADTMKNYTKGSKLVEELEDAFSLGKKAKMQTAMSKLQSLMRNNAATQYGVRKQQMEKLRTATGGNDDIMAALAGQALNSWTPRGIQGTLSVPAALGSFSLAGIPGVMGQMALTSPRAMGEAAYGAGRAAALPQGAFRLARNKGIPGAGVDAAEFAANQAFRRPARMTYRGLGAMEEEDPRGYFAR